MSAVAGDIPTRAASGSYRLWLVAALVLLVGGGAASVPFFGSDPQVAWGMVVVNFMFWVGITQFGVCFIAILRLSGAKWSRPLYRLAGSITIAFMPLAFILFLLIYFFGAEHVLYWWGEHDPDTHMSPWLNERFMLWRNLGVLALTYYLALRYLGIDLAADSAASRPKSLMQRLVHGLATRNKDPRTPEKAAHSLYMRAPVLLIVTGLAQTVLSWDFGMMLYPHWHSTVFGMYFMIGSIFGGTALIFLFSNLLARSTESPDPSERLQMKSIGIMLTGFMCLWLYFFWAQFFVTWFGNLPEETGPLFSQIFGHYEPVFWTMIVCLFALPLATLIFAKVKRNRYTLSIVSLLILLGVWLNRYLMVVPSFTDQHYPFSGLDIAITAAIAGAVLLLQLLMFRSAPMIAQWDRYDPSEDAHH